MLWYICIYYYSIKYSVFQNSHSVRINDQETIIIEKHIFFCNENKVCREDQEGQVKCIMSKAFKSLSGATLGTALKDDQKDLLVIFDGWQKARAEFQIDKRLSIFCYPFHPMKLPLFLLSRW